MAIGERIHFIRNLRGLTQKLLGIAVGLPEKSADVRMAQYETGNRTPKADLTQKLANVLDVSPMALDVPNIDSYLGLMHTLFALEDIYGLKIGEIDGEVCLRLDKSNISSYKNLFNMFTSWQEQAAKLQSGEITKEQYDQWRYNYPRFDDKSGFIKVPSSGLSDFIVDDLK
ncbi:MAG TPA: helix-turn-helix domain-containing protein [Candidatus Butyricicoccus avistercoris]|uniref:Helix-turn-helix domain-containing protein n=1 Tax=Candidatus Butyricicoccus avistercoris TaxID=2838518 RepID=A0A9D1TID9_9FIRM|nr:helix-turn-helix domain-containing protein [Candidatus Butyricicoccus avistercoris]